MVKQKKLKGGSVSAQDLNTFINESYKKNSERAGEVNGFKLDKGLSSSRAAVYSNPETKQVYVAQKQL